VGDTPRSQLVGKHPPRLLKYGVISAVDKTVLPELKPLGAVKLPGNHTPLAVDSSYAVAQIVSASVIRREPSKMTLLTSMIHPDLFLLGKHRLDTPTGLQQGAELLRRLGKYGTILKVDLKGRGGAFHEAAQVAPSLTVTGDGRFVLQVSCVPEAQVDPPRVDIPCGITVVGTQQGTAKHYRLGKLPVAAFAPPFRFGTIKVQP